MTIKHASLALGMMMTIAPVALAGPEDFAPGPLIETYGPVTGVPGAEALPADTRFKVAFDFTKRGTDGKINRGFESAARFLNMHAAAGVRPENMSLAVVVHSAAVLDLTNDQFAGEANVNAALVKILQDHGVTFYVCGQSAAYQNVAADDLLPGVKMAVSAMTAHALLQQNGYTLNPF